MKRSELTQEKFEMICGRLFLSEFGSLGRAGGLPMINQMTVLKNITINIATG